MLIEHNWYRRHLRCPDCHSELVIASDHLRCVKCSYQQTEAAQICLKPSKPKNVEFQMTSLPSSHATEILATIEIGRPNITYCGPRAARDSRGLMSEISRYLSANAGVLDLGCGPRDQAGPLEYLGYRYVGIDYQNKAADILADAHSLPFESESFDCVLSYAVLEHLHNPCIALQEIERVLKPNGIYVGTVSQGEPYHESYFHLTAWGLISLTQMVGSLEVRRLWDSGDTLRALSRMGRYPRVIRTLLKLINHLHNNVPILAPRRMGWSPQEKILDQLYRTASLCFVLQKPVR